MNEIMALQHHGSILLLYALFVNCVSSQTHLLGVVAVPRPGLMNIFTHSGNPNVFQKYSILISSYNMDRSTFDSTYMLQYPGEHIANNFTGYTPKTLYNFLYWPKEVRQVPKSVFNDDAILHFDGSTISGKTIGSVYLTNMKDSNFPTTYNLGDSIRPDPFMYSSGLWKKVDGDGRDDIMTCRVQIESDGRVRLAELVWLEQPFNGMQNRWNIHVLKSSACDSNIAETSIKLGTFDNYDVVYATGQFTKQLTFFYTTGLLNQWDRPNNIQATIIESGREFYDISIADINNDGKMDLLVTVIAETGGSVEVFEIPDDFRNANQYRRRVLASGFNSRNGGSAGRSPGIARTFYPFNGLKLKPWIMLSGGDDGRAYYLRPLLESSSDWSYELNTVSDQGPSQTISGITGEDINGDGYTELFVSIHNRNIVEIYTFKP